MSTSDAVKNCFHQRICCSYVPLSRAPSTPNSKKKLQERAFTGLPLFPDSANTILSEGGKNQVSGAGVLPYVRSGIGR